MSTQAIQAGGAEVEVRIRDRLKEQMPKIVDRLKATGETVSRIGYGMTAAAAAGVTAFSVAARNFASAGTELLTMSRSTGVAVEVLSELQYAAARTGASMSDVQEVITAVKEGKQLELWGSSSAGVIRLLQGNIAQLRREARALGADMSGEVAQSAQQLTNSMQTSAFILGAIWREIGAAAAPAVATMTERFTGAVGPLINLIRGNKAFIGAMFITLTTVAKLGASLASLGRIISMAGIALSMLSGVFVPILIGVSILAAVGAAVYLFRDTVVAAWNAILTRIAPLVNGIRTLYGVFSEMIGGVLGALGSGQFEAAGSIAWAGLVAVAWTGVEQLAEAVDAGIEYLRQYFPGIDSVVDYFRSAFGGLYDAVMAGRWDLAGEILMSKLRLVWQEGVDFLRDSWDMGMAAIKSAFPGLINFISELWHGMINALSNSIVWLMEKTGLAAEGTMDVLHKMQAEEAKARAKAAAVDPQQVLGERMMAREAERNKMRAQIAALEGQAAQANEQAGMPTVADRAAEARERLKREIAAANKGREDGGKDIPGPGAKGGPVSLPNARTEGSFTAAAAVVLGGGGSVNEKIEQNTRMMSRHLANINDNTKRNGVKR
jgi:hypothetical protein